MIKKPIKRRQTNSKIKTDDIIVKSDYYELYDEVKPKMMSKSQEYYFNYARQVAIKSPMKNKHGCIIVYKDKIISEGYNYNFDFNDKYSIHAEISAITNIKSKNRILLEECTLYVIRICPMIYGELMKYSKPCEKCQDFINKYNVKKVYYSTNYEYDKICLNI